MEKPRAKEFKEFLRAYFKKAQKTSYGKNELALLIEELYAIFLDKFMEDLGESKKKWNSCGTCISAE